MPFSLRFLKQVIVIYHNRILFKMAKVMLPYKVGVGCMLGGGGGEGAPWMNNISHGADSVTSIGFK
jgi:hypothetical protein